jgi:hypothetical protein
MVCNVRGLKTVIASFLSQCSVAVFARFNWFGRWASFGYWSKNEEVCWACLFGFMYWKYAS